MGNVSQAQGHLRGLRALDVVIHSHVVHEANNFYIESTEATETRLRRVDYIAHSF